MKKRLVIIGYYIPGIYPPGRDDVEFNLLAPAYIKAAVDSDPDLSAKYDTVILNVPTNAKDEDVIEQINEHYPEVVMYSVYIWNYDYVERSTSILKNLRPNTHVIWGGPQVTYSAEGSA